MNDLRPALHDYLKLRRSLGYKLERPAELLADFVAYLEAAQAPTITVELAVAWATMPVNAGSQWRAARLGVVRGFARYLQAREPETEIPPAGLLPARSRRPAPFLYSDADLLAIMAVAHDVASPLRSATLETVIGLLAVTGLRVGEVIRLDRQEVDFGRGLLTVRNSKQGKSRLVPLDMSTVEALSTYATRRDELCPRPAGTSFFVSRKGTRLNSGNLGALFAEVLRRADLPPRTRQGRPRLGDLRHTFAVQTLLGWYVAGVDVAPRLPVLSTYLGHVSPVSTYWYLSASPELLAAAAERLDQSLGVMS